MVNYKCELCNYLTSYKKDYNKHLNTKKHKQKEAHGTINNNVLLNSSQSTANDPPKYRQKSSIITHESHRTCLNICKYCSSKFTRTDSLSKHLKACIKKHEREKLLEEQIEMLLTESSKYKDKSSYFQAENDYHKKMLNEAGGLVQKSVSALSYVVGNYNTAPTIQMIDINEIENLDENNKKLVEDILSYYKHKTLDKYLGDSIIKLYKKDNPKDQSVWSTDTSRLTYLIKELMVNNSSNWIVDKKGIKTKEYLIDPLLEHIKTLVIHYQKNIILSTNAVEVEHSLELNKRVLKLVDDIDDGNVGNNLLKYISTHLYFSEKQLK